MGEYDLPQSDDLDEIITTKEMRDNPRDADGFHVEPCKACHGSGQFVSYSGRILGQCFKCKGKGKRVFRMSAADRERTRAKAAERKARTLSEALDAFRADHPQVWLWMEFNAQSSRPFDFAIKLREGLLRYGSLTERQIAAAEKCVASFEAAKAKREAAAPQVDTSKLEASFAKALANGLYKPRLRLCGFTISPAKAESRNAGALYVKRDGQYLGKVQGGKFFCTRECDEITKDRVVQTLADPEQSAIAFGKATGSCACCGRFLENPESVQRGIGPICASKWGW